VKTDPILQGVSAVSDASDGQVRNTADKEDKKTQATQLVELAEGVELFTTPDGDAWATFKVNAHHETYRVKSPEFQLWLQRLFYKARQGKVPNRNVLADAISILAANATFEGKQQRVHLRTAENGAKI
jgi:putative DNA primase/helicase